MIWEALHLKTERKYPLFEPVLLLTGPLGTYFSKNLFESVVCNMVAI